MQDLLGGLQAKWDAADKRRKGVKFGLPVGDGASLTNLRFADDVMLVAHNKRDITRMLSQLADAANKYGHKLHFGKTKIMTWDRLAAGCSSIFLGDKRVSILKETETEKYLGRKLCFADSCEVEVRNRLAGGWAAFHKHKGELCNRFYRTSDRVRLFDAVVSPTVLHGSSAWALTQVMEDKLRATWRKMLRYAFCLHRRSSESCAEDWVDYMQRSAHQVETMARKHGLKDWVAAYHRENFNFAGQVARQTDNR